MTNEEVKEMQKPSLAFRRMKARKEQNKRMKEGAAIVILSTACMINWDATLKNVFGC